ncbi:MAG: secretion protein HlyD [Lentisphaeria bacterium]|nr:secretion protein HlyD [Lentisphaeria bacterium]
MHALLRNKWFYLALAAAVVVGTAWGVAAWRERRPDDRLVLYGNVDVRQVNLGFRIGGRIQALEVDEGDRVKPGETVAVLDNATYLAALKAAEAQLGRAKAQLEKMENGSRPEEIEQAAAAVEMFKAAERNAVVNHERNAQLLKTDAVAEKDFDATLARRDETRAQVEYAAAKLRLLKAGFRKEEIESARAEVKAAEAELLGRRKDFDDAVLHAPSGGIIQTRVQEPGAVVNPGAVVFTLTLDRPVWVRAYVSEPDLGRIRPGMKVSVRTDSGEREYEGRIGFISPVAEFTPKSVETATLRTDLVYRLRIIVDEPGENLRQGMPVTATVRLDR